MSIIAEIAELQRKSTLELNQVWRKLFQTDPPLAGKDYMVRRLAYRVQELAHGGLSQAATTILDGLGRGKPASPKTPPKKEGVAPSPGARLIREWQGVEHVVSVLDQGYEYQGRKFKSLSAVAKAITGTHWSGPLFFGLRKVGKA
ncbi:MAG: DUF2924 domain-containing protein [Magnetococcales bacterium]|nr:DUF2924 domain-containing protein [Magnetococcales bacterium]